jgi:hypothetical protein
VGGREQSIRVFQNCKLFMLNGFDAHFISRLIIIISFSVGQPEPGSPPGFLALGITEPTQPPIQWVPGSLSLGVKQPWREAHHSPQSSAEVKNAWSYNSTPQYAFMAWCSVKAQGQLYLYFTQGRTLIKGV